MHLVTPDTEIDGPSDGQMQKREQQMNGNGDQSHHDGEALPKRQTRR